MTRFIAVFLFCLLAPLAAHDRGKTTWSGTLDLSGHDFRQGPAMLSGLWQCWWGRLLTPRQVATNQADGFLNVPGNWTGVRMGGRKLPGHGVATLRLKLRLPYPGLWGLRVREVNTAWRLYVNGSNMAAVGRPGLNRKQSIPRWAIGLVHFQATNRKCELVWQIANFHHRNGGPENTFQLAPLEQMGTIDTRIVWIELLIIGAVLLMGILHFGFWLLRRRDLAPLMFSLFCVAVAVRLSMTGERLGQTLLPWLSFEFAAKLEYLGFYLAVPAFLSFITALLREKVSHFDRLLIGAGILCSLVVIFTPVHIFSYSLIPFQFITLIALATVLIRLFRRAFFVHQEKDTVTQDKRGTKIDARATLAGFAVLALAVVNDILRFNEIIATPYLFSYALLVYMLAQAFVLARRFARANAAMERLAAEQAARHAEEAIRSREQINILSTAINQSHETVVITNTEGAIEYVNRAFEERTGYTRLEALGENPRILKSGLFPSETYQELWDTIGSGNTWIGEFHNKTKDGQFYWEKATISPIRNESGTITHYLAVKQDVTEAKAMEEELSKQREKLRQRNMDMERQLDLARGIQKRLLPQGPLPENMALLFQSMDKVGGDLCDISLLPDNKIAVFVGDVSGHGVPAALVAAMTKSLLIQTDPEIRCRPAALLARLNQALYGQTDTQFVTAVYTVCDPADMSIKYASAGHEPLFITGPSGVRQASCPEKGPPLAVLENAELEKIGKLYGESQIRLSAGEKVLLYTDGVTEAEPIGGTGRAFGEEGLLSVLRAEALHTPQEIVGRIFSALSAHRKSEAFDDDICVICLARC